MFDAILVRDLGWIICAALMVVLVAERIRMPSIVAYIIAGLILGPATGVLEVTHDVELIAEFGIALLLFVVGLELSLDKIKDVGKVAVVAGAGQIVLTALGAYVLSHLLGFEVIDSIFLAIAMTFSSTVVVVKLLDQKGDLDSLYGRIAVGIFLVQDLVVVAALTVLAGISDAGEEVEMGETLANIGMAFLGTSGLLVFALVSAWWILPRPFKWAARRPETLFAWSLCWCMLFVYASVVMNLSIELGAFLAGFSLAQLPYNHELRRRVHPLMSFFIAIFFVTLGIQMKLDAAQEFVVPIIVFSLFVLIGKAIIFMAIIARSGYDEDTAFSTSVTVAQISEFSFIFAAMGMTVGLIGEELLSVIGMVGLTTITISSYMILNSDVLYRWSRKLGLLKVFGAEGRARPPEEELITDHIIVVGMNELGQKIVSRLVASGEKVVAVDTDDKKLEGLPAEHNLLGNLTYRSVQEAAGLSRAKLLISTLHIEDTNRFLALEGRAKGVKVAIHAFDESVVEDLTALRVDYLMFPRRDGVEKEWDAIRESLIGAEAADA